MSALQEILTKRELEVASLLVRGWENKEVGNQLHISPRTVEDHRWAILKKAKARNVVELTRAFYGIEDQQAHEDVAS